MRPGPTAAAVHAPQSVRLGSTTSLSIGPRQAANALAPPRDYATLAVDVFYNSIFGVLSVIANIAVAVIHAKDQHHDREQVLADIVLSASTETATIHAPLEAVDIRAGSGNLPDREYQRCAPPNHKAAGYTTTDDGRPMSINVEMIGTGLVIQHYVYGFGDSTSACGSQRLVSVRAPPQRKTLGHSTRGLQCRRRRMEPSAG
jgi:hypothetical protein